MKFVTFLFLFFVTLHNFSFGFGPTSERSDFDRSILKINEDGYLGKTVPDIKMMDEKGDALTLSKLAGKPLILSIVYYTCPGSCPVLNEGLAEALKFVGLKLGDEYDVITISFDEKDTLEDAKQFRKRLHLKMKDSLPGQFEKWIFATASSEEMRKLTKAVGYRFFYSVEDKTFYHPNVYIFLSPDRKITRYIFGLFPLASDLKLALMESADGKIGKFPVISAAVLACFKYDPSMGGYKLNLPFVFGMGGLSLGFFTGLIVFFHARKMKKRKRLHNRLYRV